jgi:hypothetical protein
MMTEKKFRELVTAWWTGLIDKLPQRPWWMTRTKANQIFLEERR